MTGARISDMTPLPSLPASGGTIPVVKTGETTNYGYDLATDMAGRLRHVSDRSALAALSTAQGAAAMLREPGHEGDFAFDSSDLSAKVAADPQKGIYVPKAADPIGATGAWIRIGTLKPAHFATSLLSSSVDCSVPLQAFWDAVLNEARQHDATGEYGMADANADGKGLIIGPSSLPVTPPGIPLTGRMKLFALSQMNEMVRFRNMQYRKWNGGIHSVGVGGSSYASRTCLINTYFENCARLQVTNGVRGQFFGLANNWCGTANNNMMQFGAVIGSDIGSGRATFSLTGNWSTAVNSGSSGSTAQRTTINLDTFYSTALDAYLSVGNEQVQLRINGYLYYVYAIDRALGTASIYPWLDPAAGASGTYEWVLGGNHCTKSSDGNLIEVGLLDGLRCGRNLSDASLYGSVVKNTQTNLCGTEMCLGSDPGGAFMGTNVLGRYNEGGANSAHEQIVNLSRFGNSVFHTAIGDSGANDLTKFWNVGDPRVTAGTINGGEFGSTLGGSMTVSRMGRLLFFVKSNLAKGPGATYSLRGQSLPPATEMFGRDSHNLTLTVQGSGENNRLFGYSGGQVGYIGTGTNGAPTGSFVFTPPSGGTINGGAVDATATFSDFEGAVVFAYEHTDSAQLTWRVRPLCGKMRHGWIGVNTTGNASTTLNATASKMTQYFDTALTAARTVTLPAPGKEGRRFRVVRTANATGAFNLTVQTSAAVALKVLAAASTWADFEDDGTEYRLTAAGSL
jgi:hypothetical protein